MGASEHSSQSPTLPTSTKLDSEQENLKSISTTLSWVRTFLKTQSFTTEQ